MAKEEVRVFIDEAYVKAIDGMITDGQGTSRSEVIREIVKEWLRSKGKVR